MSAAGISRTRRGAPDADPAPAKRHNSELASAKDDEGNASEVELMPDAENPLHVQTSSGGHFLGIQPQGNLFIAEPRRKKQPSSSMLACSDDGKSESDSGAASGDHDEFEPVSCRDSGLGVLAALSDEAVVERFLRCLDGPTLAQLACVSRAFYGFVYGGDVELWRPLVIGTFGGEFTYLYWWRTTFAHEYCKSAGKCPLAGTGAKAVPSSPPPVPLKLHNMYSDYLFQPW